MSSVTIMAVSNTYSHRHHVAAIKTVPQVMSPGHHQCTNPCWNVVSAYLKLLETRCQPLLQAPAC